MGRYPRHQIEKSRHRRASEPESRNRAKTQSALATVEDERDRAVKAETIAEKSKRNTKRLYYGSDMREAVATLADEDTGRIRELLLRHLPEHGESDNRDFVSHYLWNIIHPYNLMIPHGWPINGIKLPKDERIRDVGTLEPRCQVLGYTNWSASWTSQLVVETTPLPQRRASPGELLFVAILCHFELANKQKIQQSSLMVSANRALRVRCPAAQRFCPFQTTIEQSDSLTRNGS